MQLKHRLKYLECRGDQADARLDTVASQTRVLKSRIGVGTSGTIRVQEQAPERAQRELVREETTSGDSGGEGRAATSSPKNWNQ